MCYTMLTYCARAVETMLFLTLSDVASLKSCAL